MDSSDPLYVFDSLCRKDGDVVHSKLVRDVGGFSVGLEHSMMKSLGIFKEDKILTLASLCSTIGLSYSLFGPLLRGATSILLEDLWSFPYQAQQIVEKNKIKNLFLHSHIMNKTMF